MPALTPAKIPLNKRVLATLALELANSQKTCLPSSQTRLTDTRVRLRSASCRERLSEDLVATAVATRSSLTPTAGQRYCRASRRP